MATSKFTSSTRSIPERDDGPRHVAIIMDGNGRWARKRFLPRVAGHVRGVETVRTIIRCSIERKVSHLTLFAFSSENWRRPAEEVSFLMQLFMRSLKKEIERIHENDIRFRVIGDLSRFDASLVSMIRDAERLTENNTRLNLTIAANYGGRWDILQAVNKLVATSGSVEDITEEALEPHLSMAFAPEPDLFIRTGGEKRISNFLLWQLAYTELYFTDTLWPDFGDTAFDTALASYGKRERRFGRTSEQLEGSAGDEGEALA
ncbi:polyprenyl diphosphate synthase [Denitromonas iodatirespirans]|uniref:Isoprenyl transferase n=1 Tax=Denitromonas iodatirespirans TaxID=2795389 RepID=A0A944D7U2_DENI1|nr:polyprenyl diphosphate synthase [Denitromonas iodatirespirans]MBT0960162.1 di-trans,poly-cis-decaprenylcistransferase [Denitromonas iodatirespirans]